MRSPTLFFTEFWRWFTGAERAERAAADIRANADALIAARAVKAELLRPLQGRDCQPFALEESPNRQWRRRIPLPDVLRWRTYLALEVGAYEQRLEVFCALLDPRDHEAALAKVRACTGRTERAANGHLHVLVGPTLIVGVRVSGPSGVRALYLRDPVLREQAVRSDEYKGRVEVSYLFTGSALEWGDAPTTNDPDQPRTGMNVGEPLTVDTAPAYAPG